MVSWGSQNDIVECLSKLVRSKIMYEIPGYYAIIVDQVADRFSKEENFTTLFTLCQILQKRDALYLRNSFRFFTHAR